MARAKRSKPRSKTKAKRGMAATKAKPPLKPGKDGVVRLSGGNPQIAKGEGDAVLQKYIAAMPGWQREVGERIDAIVTRVVPGVQKAVKWNSPFYGVEGKGWILNFHVYAKYVKLAFFAGTSLEPMPPGESKSKGVRYYDVREGELDEKQLTSWVKQAATRTGWIP